MSAKKNILLALGLMIGSWAVWAETQDKAHTQAPTLYGQEAPTVFAQKASRIAIGEKGFLEFHGLIQNWFMGSFDDNEPYAKLGSARSTFRIRRFEFRITGEIVPEIAFTGMFDLAKVQEFRSFTVPTAPTPTTIQQPVGKTAVLQDVFVTFKYIPYVNLSIGQGKQPIAYEVLIPPANLLFAERAETSRLIADRRDIGFWAQYRFKYLGYLVGIYNGAMANNLSFDPHKEGALRLEAFPVDHLTIAASGFRTLAGNVAGAKTIFNADVIWDSPEFFALGTVLWSQFFNNAATPVETRPLGFSLSAGYTVGRLLGDWQPALRFDWYDPDTLALNNAYWKLTAGVNLLLLANLAKVQLNYIHTQSHVANSNNDSIYVNAQVSF